MEDLSVRSGDVELAASYSPAGETVIVALQGAGEGTRDFELALFHFDAHDVGDHFDAVDLFGDVMNGHFHGSGSGRRHAVISNFLVDGADQVRGLRVVKLESERGMLL